MISTLRVLLLLLVGTATWLGAHNESSHPSDDPLLARVAIISEEKIYEHITYFASPACGGRGTPSPGLDLAGTYVVQKLEEWGISPATPEENYYLPWTLESLTGEESHFVWMDEEDEEREIPQGSFYPIPGSKELAVYADPVFVGYAIDARNERWQDLSERKVKGKIVFAFTREPFADQPKSKKFDGLKPTKHSSWKEKAKAVEKAGGVALVLVPDPAAYPDADHALPGLLPQPLGARMGVRAIERLANFPDIPVLSCSRAVAEEIFDESMEEYHAGMEKRKKPRLLKSSKKLNLDLGVKWNSKEVDYWNIVAKIPGTDGDGETLVIGAHLDHVGRNYAAALWGGEVALHPGADDNASGASALLCIAEALAGTQPKNDILLIWFTAEERGLLGSRAYCEDPLVPHADTIAMLNMDQIARTNPKSMNVGGLWDRPDWEAMVRKQHRAIKNPLKLDSKGGRDVFARSDHYPFHQNEVPVMFFFEGDIADNPVYHKPGDVAETLDPEKTTWIARDVLATAWALAFEGVRP
ncbi:MAG: M28 family peptidase [Planctomycetes bacterium]|nr:M28 family peptidase [Planctomycetota bacterium]